MEAAEQEVRKQRVFKCTRLRDCRWKRAVRGGLVSYVGNYDIRYAVPVGSRRVCVGVRESHAGKLHCITQTKEGGVESWLGKA